MAAVSQEAIPRQQETDTSRREGTYEPHPRRSLGQVIRNMSWSDRIGLVAGTVATLGSGGAAAVIAEGALTQPTEISTQVVERQTPYLASVEITPQMLNEKYGINIITGKEAFQKLGHQELANSSIPTELTQEQWHVFDYALANIPPQLYEEVNGHKLNFAITDLKDWKIGDSTCIQTESCAATFVNGRNQGEFILMSPDVLNDKYSASQVSVHELTHYYELNTKLALIPEIQKILGDQAYLHYPEFADGQPSSDAIEALKSFAGGTTNSKDPHQNIAEGLAITAQDYTKGYAAFMNDFGPALDNKEEYYQGLPVSDALLKQTFPKTDTFYKLIQDKVFYGYGYAGNGNMIDGKDAIPTQLDQMKFATSTKETPASVVVGDETIGTISGGRITSINRGLTPK
jgi:hypothetical protein